MARGYFAPLAVAMAFAAFAAVANAECATCSPPYDEAGPWQDFPSYTVMNDTSIEYDAAEYLAVQTCEAGTYCKKDSGENGTGEVGTFECPKGYYCPPRTVAPVECRYGEADCPAGSTLPAAPPSSVLGVFIVFNLLLLTGARTAYQKWSDWDLEKKKGREEELQQRKSHLRLVFGLIKGKANLGDRMFEGLRPVSKPISLGFKDLSLTLKSGKSVLKGVHGEFSHGRMAAVMGPSGAGKSTFFNALTGRAPYGIIEGTVTVNGQRPPGGTLEKYRPVIGFVPQDDICFEMLTVFENFMFTARLRLEVDVPELQRELVVKDTVDMLQLAHVQDTVVGGVESRGVSGGQKKRVNIGMEIVSSPSVLFMDEPTSGLDATSTLAIMQALHDVAGLKVLIAAVIHQPRYTVYTAFDDVLLLAPPGRQVYLGSAVQSSEFFQGIGFKQPAYENPADWLLDVMSGSITKDDDPKFRPSDLENIWHSSKMGKANLKKAEAAIAGSKEKKSGDGPKKSMRSQLVTPEQLDAIETLFNEIDEDKDGEIDEDEFVEYFETKLPPGEADQVDWEEIIADMDADEDGMVNLAELTKFMLRMAGLINPVMKDDSLATMDKKDFIGDDKDSGDKKKKKKKKKGDSDDISIDIDSDDEEDNKKDKKKKKKKEKEGKGGKGKGKKKSRGPSGPSPVEQAIVAAAGMFKTASELTKKAAVVFDRSLDLAAKVSQDGIKNAFKKGDSSDEDDVIPEEAARVKPGPSYTLSVMCERSAVQLVRSIDNIAFTLFITISATVVVGALRGPAESIILTATELLTPMIILGMMSAVQGLNTFTPERLTCKRESVAGINMGMYFVAKNMLDIIPMTLTALVFAFIYDAFAQFRMSQLGFFTAAWVAAWSCFGFAYMCGFLVSHKKTLLATVVILLVMAGFFHGVNPPIAKHRDNVIGFVMGLTYSRHVIEYITINEYKMWESSYNGFKVWNLNLIGYCGIDSGEVEQEEADRLAQNLDFMADCAPGISLWYCFVLGIIWRFIALCVLLVGAKKQ